MGHCSVSTLGMLQREYFGILKESAVIQSKRIIVGVHFSSFFVGISLPPHQHSSADIRFFATDSNSKFQFSLPFFSATTISVQFFKSSLYEWPSWNPWDRKNVF